MNIDKLIREELTKRGIDVGIEEVEVIKNAVCCKGIKIINCHSTNICPIVYYDKNETISAIADRIAAAVASNLPAFDIIAVQTKDFFLTNAYISCCKHNGMTQDIVSKQYLNLDLIIKLHIPLDSDDFCSISVTKQLLKIIGYTIDEAFQIASDNSRKTVTIRSMDDILSEPIDTVGTMHVISCNHGIGGASAIIFTDVLKNWCQAHDMTDVYILPSSTEEMILVSDNAITTSALLKINKNITSSIVDPILALNPAVYHYSTTNNLVTIAAAEVIDDD